MATARFDGREVMDLLAKLKDEDEITVVGDDEIGADAGDPRRCRRHPEEKISSPDGMFDSPCGKCEEECEDGYYDTLR